METASDNRRPPADDEELLLRVRGFIASAADVPLEHVGPETHIFEELGVDSLGAACIFIDISFEFGVREPTENVDFVSYNTARAICGYVRGREGAHD